MPTTIYQVSTRYNIEGDAAAKLGTISGAATRAASSSNLLGKALGFVSVGAGLVAGKKLFIDLNKNAEDAKIGLSALINLNLGGSFEEAQGKAENMFSVFQKEAEKSTAATADLVDFATRIADPLFRAGGGLKQLQSITAAAVPAAQIFGVGAEQAALDIEQALTRGVETRDRFANKLLNVAGIERDAFNKLDPTKRLPLLERALGHSAIAKARSAMEQSFSGVTGTLIDKVQILAKGVGLPLFKEITKEIVKWNDWISKNPAKIQEFAEKFSKALIDGFSAVKSVASFLVENRDVFLALAAAWAGGKIGGALGGAAGGIGGMLGPGLGGAKAGSLGAIGAGGLAGAGIAKMLGRDLKSFDGVVLTSVGAMAGLPGPIGAVAKAALALETVFLGLVGKAEAEEDARATRTAEIAFDLGILKRSRALDQQLSEQQRRNVAMQAQGAKRAMAQGIFAAGDIKEALFKEQKPLLLQAKDFGTVAEDMTINLVNLKRAYIEHGASIEDATEAVARTAGVMSIFKALNPDELKRYLFGTPPPGEKGGRPSPNKMNVNINKIEVASQDPDRFAFGIIHSFEEIVRNPTQAKSALARGLG